MVESRLKKHSVKVCNLFYLPIVDQHFISYFTQTQIFRLQLMILNNISLSKCFQFNLCLPTNLNQVYSMNLNTYFERLSVLYSLCCTLTSLHSSYCNFITSQIREVVFSAFCVSADQRIQHEQGEPQNVVILMIVIL